MSEPDTKSRTLSDWLNWLERLHPKTIEMGLERINRVRAGLKPCTVPFPSSRSAGTNGKGSTCAMMEAILSRAGYRVGCYTSPHLLRYNERVRINRQEASDDELCNAFQMVESARLDSGIPLTYFEFGTLAAMQLFKQAEVEIAILEVGLGGRLDAVNIFDADCAVITSIDFDHMDYLGDTREKIGFEKAGIFRSGKAAICSEPDIPAGCAASCRSDRREFDAHRRALRLLNQVQLDGVIGEMEGKRHSLPYPACVVLISCATPVPVLLRWMP